MDEISVVGRNTQGVRLIRLGEGERLIGIERVDEALEGAAEGESPEGGALRVGCRRAPQRIAAD